MSAGSIALVTGSGQSLPGTTAALIDVGTISSDVDSILSESSGVFTPQSEGYYLIVAEGTFQSTHNNRQNIAWEIKRNSSDYAGAAGSGYSRNNSNDFLGCRASMVAHFNGTTDTFEVEDYRDAGNGTPAGSYSATRLTVIQLTEGGTSSTAYGHYGTPTSGAYSGTTPTAVAGWDVITETDTDVIELQAGGTDIRLKEARPYLIVYGLVNSDSGGARTGRIADVTLEGSRVAHAVAAEYQRNSADQYAYPAGVALVEATANDDINVRAWGRTVSSWGTFDNGTWTLSSAAGDAGVMVIALPADTGLAIYEDTTGGQSVTGSGPTDMNVFASSVGTEDSPFSRQSNTAVDVTSGTDVLAWAAVLAERTASSGTRHSMSARWEVAGVDQSDTGSDNYLRGDQGGDDHYNSTVAALYVGSVSTNDTFNFEKFTRSGQNTGNNDATAFGGSFFIDLTTLAGGSSSQDLTGDQLSVTPVFPTGDVTAGAVDLSGVQLSVTPAFPTGVVAAGAVGLEGVQLSVTPVFPTGDVTAGAVDLSGVQLSVTPVFPAGAVGVGAVGLEGDQLSVTPAFPTGSVATGAVGLEGVQLSVTPAFPAGSVDAGGSVLEGDQLLVTPTFPTGTLAAGAVGLVGDQLATTPVFPAGAVAATVGVDGVQLSVAPAFPTGTMSVGAVDIGGIQLVVTPSFPAGVVAAGAATLNLDGDQLSVAPSFPTGTMSVGAVGLSGVQLVVTPTFPTGAVASTVNLAGDQLSVSPAFPAGAVVSTVDLVGVRFVVVPVFRVGVFAGGASPVAFRLGTSSDTTTVESSGTTSEVGVGAELTGTVGVSSDTSGVGSDAESDGMVDVASVTSTVEATVVSTTISNDVRER